MKPVMLPDRLVPVLRENAAVKLIGLGGVGGIVARYLAIFMASLDRPLRLVLVDGDDFEPANAGRMAFREHGNKAAVVRDELLAFAGGSRLSVAAVEQHVTPDNVAQIVHDGDLVILAVDNHATRKLVDDHCSGALREVCLLSGGNDGVEELDGKRLRGTYGNVQIYVKHEGREITPSLSRFHPEIARPADRLPTEDCVNAVASTPQILFANLAVASALLGTLWLHLCGGLHYGELCFDIAEGLMRPVALPVPQEEPAGGPEAA